MKNSNKDGFTLGELLATVAIMLILCNIIFVSLENYNKSLKLMEADGTAKELFIVAQEHLSLAKSSGEFGRLDEAMLGEKLSTPPAYARYNEGEYYYIIHHAGENENEQTEERNIYDMTLPELSIDETVRKSGNYAIVYERKTASIVAVLYSGTWNSFGTNHSIVFDESDIRKIDEVSENKEKRKNYEKNGVRAIVGCYTDVATYYGTHGKK